jgi:ribosome production factor 1
MVKINKNKSSKNKKSNKSNTNKVLKSDNVNELKEELERISELNRTRPVKNMKNKQKRRELVLVRSSMKNKIKSKLRKRKQKMREELDNENVEETQIPKTVDSLREKDETYVEENDEELEEEIKNDEYTEYFNKEYDPQILITTSVKHTGAIFKFVKELKDTIPNSYFYYRKKFNLKDIIELAKEKKFTDVIVVYERLRKPYRLSITHLPDGPTAEFKISNVVYHEELPEAARNTNHNPELIFKNFKTKLGHRLSRILNSLFIPC